MAWVWSMAHSMAYPLTYVNFVVFASVKIHTIKKESSLKLNTWTNKGWHEVTYTNTATKKKTMKRGGLFKKRFHYKLYITLINFYGWPWCDAMRKLMFSKSMFFLFLWQLVQVLLWFKIRPSGTFFFFFNFSPISDWGYQKVSLVECCYKTF